MLARFFVLVLCTLIALGASACGEVTKDSNCTTSAECIRADSQEAASLVKEVKKASCENVMEAWHNAASNVRGFYVYHRPDCFASMPSAQMDLHKQLGQLATVDLTRVRHENWNPKEPGPLGVPNMEAIAHECGEGALQNVYLLAGNREPYLDQIPLCDAPQVAKILLALNDHGATYFERYVAAMERYLPIDGAPSRNDAPQMYTFNRLLEVGLQEYVKVGFAGVSLHSHGMTRLIQARHADGLLDSVLRSTLSDISTWTKTRQCRGIALSLMDLARLTEFRPSKTTIAALITERGTDAVLYAPDYYDCLVVTTGRRRKATDTNAWVERLSWMYVRGMVERHQYRSALMAALRDLRDPVLVAQRERDCRNDIRARGMYIVNEHPDGSVSYSYPMDRCADNEAPAQ